MGDNIDGNLLGGGRLLLPMMSNKSDYLGLPPSANKMFPISLRHSTFHPPLTCSTGNTLFNLYLLNLNLLNTSHPESWAPFSLLLLMTTNKSDYLGLPLYANKMFPISLKHSSLSESINFSVINLEMSTTTF